MYKIKSSVLKAKHVRIEGVNRTRMEQRLATVRKDTDPNAKLIHVVTR